MHHRTIQINYQPDATDFQFIILMFIYSSTCFARSLAPSSGAQQLQWQPLVFPSYHGDSCTVVRGRAGRPTRPGTQHDCHHDTMVKPEILKYEPMAMESALKEF
jgi:hypothetical protein